MAADASADGQRSFVGGDAGNGTGGNVHINAATGGQITVNGNLTGSASGTGGAFINGSGAGAPGDGRGGSAVVHAETGGDITVTGNVYLTADGIGGNVSNPIDTSAAGGNGYGGEARMATYNDGSTITAGDVFLNVNGHGGDGFSGGAGYGGGQIVFINNEPEQVGSGAGIQGHAGTMSLGDLNFNAVGTGGDASLGFGGSGGYAQGGTTYLEARASLIVEQFSAATINGGNVTMDVNAVGGVGGAGFSDIETETFIAAGAGGNAQGGTYTGANSTGGAHVIADSQGGSSISATSISSRLRLAAPAAPAATTRRAAPAVMLMAAPSTPGRLIPIRIIRSRSPTSTSAIWTSTPPRSAVPAEQETAAWAAFRASAAMPMAAATAASPVAAAPCFRRAAP